VELCFGILTITVNQTHHSIKLLIIIIIIIINPVTESMRKSKNVCNKIVAIDFHSMVTFLKITSFMFHR